MTSDTIEGVESSGSITKMIFGGPFGMPVIVSRSDLGSGASGLGSGSGAGAAMHPQGPLLIGQKPSSPESLPQQLIWTTG